MSLALNRKSVTNSDTAPDLAPDLVDTLRLIRSENVGAMTFHALIRRFGTAAKALEMIPEMALKGGSRKPIILYSRDKAEDEIEKTLRYGEIGRAHV